MDDNLHVLFERALDDEPPAPPGDLARDAMADGTRLRRRRRLLTVGSVTGAAAALVTIVALNLAAPADQTVQFAAVPVPGATTPCVSTTQRSVTSVAIYLTPEITDQQRQSLQQSLSTDPRVRDYQYESRGEAFERFKALWQDSPEFVKSVGADSLPESYQVELVKAAQYQAFVAGLRGVAGIQDVVGMTCLESPAAREGK